MIPNKICFVGPELPILPVGGAIQAQTYELARLLALSGHEVHIISCVDPPSEALKTNNLFYHNLNSRFKFSKIKTQTLVYDLYELIRKTKEKIKYLCYNRKIDIVHCVYGFSAVGTCLALRDLPVCTVFYEHNATPWLPEYKLHIPWFRSNSYKIRSILGHYLDLCIRSMIFRRFDGVVAMSNFIKRKMEKKINIDPRKIRTVYFGVDVDKFRQDIDCKYIRDRFFVGPDPLILYVGRLSPRKGIEYLIKAAPLILKKYPSAKFMLVGPKSIYFDRSNVDNYSLFIRNLIEKHHLKKSFIITGFQDDLTAFYAASDIFVCPTLYESGGIVVGEAMACGKPIVTTNSSSLPELIDNGKSGILVPPQDEKALAKAVIKLLSDNKLAKRLGENARIQAVNKFSWKVILGRMLETYKYFCSTSARSDRGTSSDL